MGGEGGVIPLGSYDLSDPKNPRIADRKRSTKSPIATIRLFMLNDLSLIMKTFWSLSTNLRFNYL